MNESAPTLSARHTRHIIWTLLSLMPIVGMAVDLVAPSLPAIAHSLHASDHLTKNVISIYLLGYAIGNFFTGFITDALGRQKLIRIGLLCFIVVSLLPIFFGNITALLVTRLLQGITLGAVAVLVRAIISDVLPHEQLIRVGPLIGTMWGLGPVLGPVIGGYLQYYFGWHAAFYFFVITAILGLLATFFIVPETHFNRHPLRLSIIKKNMAEILSHRLFMALIMLMGLAYSLIIFFNTTGPFLIQTTLHYNSVFFGHLALCLGIVFLSATIICRHLLKHYQAEQLFFILINVFFALVLLFLFISYKFPHSIILIAVISAIMFFACGFIFPMSMGKGMSLFRHIAGSASATMYFINILITSLMAFVASLIEVSNLFTLTLMYSALLFGCFIIYWGLVREKTN